MSFYTQYLFGMKIAPPERVALINTISTRSIEEEILEEAIKKLPRLPEQWKPAAELTDDEKFAIAVAHGAPYKTSFEDGKLRFTTAVPVGIADRGDGTWVVAIQTEALYK